MNAEIKHRKSFPEKRNTFIDPSKAKNIDKKQTVLQMEESRHYG